MAPKTRKQLGILAGLLILLMIALVYNRDGDPVSATATTAPVRSSGAMRARPAVEVDVVRLNALTRARIEPQAGHRNPFRFGAAAPPAPEPSMAPSPSIGRSGPVEIGPPLPIGPPPPPPPALQL